ncbi:MAG: Hsp33 family molecular chaperone HslO [Clostridia bacterium]|nr:Hsp33 family molecular chaperone HslO [Clostridia bacterium]
MMVRLVVADTKELVEQARVYHNSSATGSALLGRLLTAASIMGSDLKDPDFSVTLRVDGDGPAGYAIAVAEGDGYCRGCIMNPAVDLPLKENGKLNVGGAVGQGSLTVIKDMHLKEPYVGKIELVSGEIAEDITEYLYYSEQTPGVCSLGVLVGTDGKIAAAGGFILSLMPGADEEVIKRVEQDIADLPPMTKMLSDGMTPEEIAKLVLKSDFGFVTRTMPCGYRCRCSEERTENMLLSLGRTELERLAKEDDTIEVTCHFCDAKYRISASELLKKVKKA